jgi:hypothetical protein
MKSAETRGGPITAWNLPGFCAIWSKDLKEWSVRRLTYLQIESCLVLCAGLLMLIGGPKQVLEAQKSSLLWSQSRLMVDFLCYFSWGFI